MNRPHRALPRLSAVLLAATSIVVLSGCPGDSTGVPQPMFQLVILKDAQPDDAQVFQFTMNGGTPMSLDDNPASPTPNMWGPIFMSATTTHTVMEAPQAGWNAPVVTCISAVGPPLQGAPGSTFAYTPGGVTITPVAGAVITCTFVNSKVKPASITVIKDAQPDDAQDFVFTTNVPGATSFSLDDDANGTLSFRHVLNNVPSGTWTVTETQVPGWTVSGISCVGTATTTTNPGAGSATVTLVQGQEAVCTFTNVAQPSSITIVKDAQPNDSTDFAFTSTIPGNAAFSLDDDANGTLPGQRVISNVPAGSYTITEGQLAGWALSALSCTPGAAASTSLATRTATVTIAPGTNVVCTFTNTAMGGSITIVKDAAPDDLQDFEFTVSGALSSCCMPFLLDDDASLGAGNGTLANSRTFSNLAAGSYTFQETPVPGWALSGIVCTGGGTTVDVAHTLVDIVLTAGASVVCTFTNARQTGTLTVVKDAQPNNNQDFRFVTAGGLLAPFLLDDDSDAVNPGARTFTVNAGVDYTVTEDSVGGWRMNSVNCVATGPAGSTTTTNVPARSFTANVAPGAAVTCTVVNVRLPGTITLVKDAQPDDPQDFTFTYNHNTSSPNFSPVFLDDDGDVTNALPDRIVLTNLVPGTFIFTEQGPPAGWVLSAINCSGGNTSANLPGRQLTVNLAAGDSVVCTYVNTRSTATLTVIKDAQPDDAQTFRFVATGGSLPSPFFLDNDPSSPSPASQTFTILSGITYSITEDAVAGWTTPSIQCTLAVPGNSVLTTNAAARTFTVNATPGANVTCTVINVKTP